MSNENNHNSSQAVNVMGILAIFVSILLILSIIGSLRSGVVGYSFSFSGLLDYLSNAPSIIPKFNLDAYAIIGDWGIFNFLKDFFSFFTKIFGFASWFVSLIWNAIEYVAYFFSFLFSIG